MSLEIKHCLRTGKALQYLLDNQENVQGGEEFIQGLIDNEKELLIDVYFNDLSWIDYYAFPLIEEKTQDLLFDDSNIHFKLNHGYSCGWKKVI